jgi:hypothetical protein
MFHSLTEHIFHKANRRHPVNESRISAWIMSSKIIFVFATNSAMRRCPFWLGTAYTQMLWIDIVGQSIPAIP